MSASAEHLAAALRTRIRGETLTDPGALEAYTTDKSIYRVVPRAVCFPQDIDDVVALVRFAAEEGIPLTPRGKGSGTAGACLGSGIIISFAKSVALSGISPGTGSDAMTIHAGAGALHQHVQETFRAAGFFLPADPSSGSISAIGGNLGTKASGPHELRHGSIDRYVNSLQFVTAAGEYVDTADSTSIPARIRDGIVGLGTRLRSDADAVRRLQKQTTLKCASGYQLGGMIADAPIGRVVDSLLVGSIGTLGIITSATLRGEPYVAEKASALLFFGTLAVAGEAVAKIRDSGATAIEIVNSATLALIRRRNLDLPLPGSECHMLIVEYEGESSVKCVSALADLVGRTQPDALVGPPVEMLGAEGAGQRLWRVRKEILPTINAQPGDMFAPSIVNDVGVPPESLPEFIQEAESIFADLGLTAAIYGHAGSGNLHLRPFFKKSDPRLSSLLEETAARIYAAVLRRGGTVTAEHGMGRLRAPFLEAEWGSSVVGYMREVKELFDPGNLLNPGILFSSRRLTDEMRDFG